MYKILHIPSGTYLLYDSVPASHSADTFRPATYKLLRKAKEDLRIYLEDWRASQLYSMDDVEIWKTHNDWQSYRLKLMYMKEEFEIVKSDV